VRGTEKEGTDRKGEGKGMGREREGKGMKVREGAQSPLYHPVIKS